MDASSAERTTLRGAWANLRAWRRRVQRDVTRGDAAAPPGLSSEEAAARLRVEGANELAHDAPRRLLAMLGEVLREPMILPLLAAGVIYLVLGDLEEAMALLFSVVVVVAITSLQERKTERALAAASPARPRDGGGASLYGGTLVVRGHATAEVHATGPRSEMGRIGAALAAVEGGPTPLQAKIRRLVRSVAAAGALLCAALVVVFGLTRGGLVAGRPRRHRARHGRAARGVPFEDPVRPGVPEAVAECLAAGLRVVMVAGDAPETARAIARQVGLPEPEAVVTGAELDRLDDDALRSRAARTSVFARTVPEQKLRLVQALRAGGDVVAMTGDGVNDAPALKAAHIGVAMGGRGTDVAREAAAIVITDDDFTSIVTAVRTGRRIFDNLRRAIAYVLAVHVPIAGLSLVPVLAAHDLALALGGGLLCLAWFEVLKLVRPAWLTGR